MPRPSLPLPWLHTCSRDTCAHAQHAIDLFFDPTIATEDPADVFGNTTMFLWLRDVFGWRIVQNLCRQYDEAHVADRPRTEQDRVDQVAYKHTLKSPAAAWRSVARPLALAGHSPFSRSNVHSSSPSILFPFSLCSRFALHATARRQIVSGGRCGYVLVFRAVGHPSVGTAPPECPE